MFRMRRLEVAAESADAGGCVRVLVNGRGWGVASFTTLMPILVPVPVLLLGVLVCIVQTAVFCILSSVYIGIAVAHEEH